jgi:hypothetical protein
MPYLILFFVLVAIYLAFVLFAKRFAKYKKYINTIFVLFIFASYLYVVIYMYRDVGPYDWNFLNTMPTANVSPFMFCLVPLILIMPKRIRGYLFTLVGLLSFGMLIAGLGGAIGFMMRDYKFHWHIAMDSIAHVLISLWGVYLVKSGQVELEPKKAVRSGSIIVSVALIMLVLNLIFDKAFFGLSLYGKHNIYNNVLFKSGIVSALAYFVGLFTVLLVGYFYHKILNKQRK